MHSRCPRPRPRSSLGATDDSASMLFAFLQSILLTRNSRRSGAPRGFLVDLAKAFRPQPQRACSPDHLDGSLLLAQTCRALIQSCSRSSTACGDLLLQLSGITVSKTVCLFAEPAYPSMVRVLQVQVEQRRICLSFADSLSSTRMAEMGHGGSERFTLVHMLKMQRVLFVLGLPLPLVSQIMPMKLYMKGWILCGSGSFLHVLRWTRTLAVCRPSMHSNCFATSFGKASSSSRQQPGARTSRMPSRQRKNIETLDPTCQQGLPMCMQLQCR